MKKIMTLLLFSMLAVCVNAQEKKEDSNKPVFTVIKENPITSIKDQSRSGTCWAYSTLAYFESEILKATGKTYDLCETFVANKDYMDRAIQTVRLHGDCQFSQGGSAYDVYYVLKNYGICPEDAMPLPGTLYGDSLNNYTEFFGQLEPYVAGISKTKSKKLSSQWKEGMQGILDAYLGKCPESFTYEGKTYTPQTFAASLGLDWKNYITITSYSHHPYYSRFAVEVQDNWRNPLSWNLPLEDMARIIENAVMNGYTVAWGGDVSEDGFTRNGLAYFYDTKQLESYAGSDMARWLKLSASKRNNILDSLGCKVPELEPTAEQRQERYDNWQLTDDHGMLIYGIAKDQYGKEYYMVKNSWGETGDYKGTWYMSKNFIVANTMDYMININAIPKDIIKKMEEAVKKQGIGE